MMKDKYRFLVAGVLIIVVMAIIFFYRSFSPSVSGPELISIVLTADGFKPNQVTIPLGSTTVFSTNVDRPFWPASNLHPSHEQYSDFDPLKPIPPGETWSFTFLKAGEWNMHDHIRSYYTGTIYVTPE